MLEKNLIPARSVWDIQQNCGWSRSATVSVTGQNGRNFCLVKPGSWTTCGWKYQLVEGISEGPVVLSVTKSGHKSTVTIKDPKTEQTIEMRSHSYLRRIREFTWEGQTYMWKRSSKLCARKLTYTLTRVGSPVPLAQNTWDNCWWRGKGCITVSEEGSHIPAHLVIAMGLSMEQLWRDDQHGGIYGS